MIRPRPVFLLLAAAALFSGCDSKPVASTPAGSPVLATAGDEVITVADFEKEVQRRIAKRVPVPDKAVLIEEMLVRLAAVARAKQAKLDADAETKHEMDNVLISKLRAQELQAKQEAVTVSDEELRAAYEAGKAKHTNPAKVQLALLYIQGDRAMSDAKKAELRGRMEEALRKAAEHPAEGGRGGGANGFGQVGAEYSDDQVSRYNGGIIGWLNAGEFSYRWPKAVLEAGYALEKGKCSPVIEVDGSLYAVMKTDFRDGSTTSFEDSKNSLRRDVLKQKREAIETAFLTENRTRTGAEIKTEVLSTITLPAAPARTAPVADTTPPALPGMNPPSR